MEAVDVGVFEQAAQPPPSLAKAPSKKGDENKA